MITAPPSARCCVVGCNGRPAVRRERYWLCAAHLNRYMDDALVGESYPDFAKRMGPKPC